MSDTMYDDRAPADMLEGSILAGKYRVERTLGRGGMGVVLCAHHLQLDERVAIKLMLPAGLSSPEAIARFGREARAAVKIKSEHVARVSDVGSLSNGAPYMVMEYLEGDDLSSWLVQYGRLSVEQAVEFVLQASEAIAEAHSLGIVHRDLKPANLFVIRRPDGALSVKVLDFGISKMSGAGNSASDFGMTKTHAMLGSPVYMSPEQMHSAKEADVRCDIWALGVILYELLAGSTPFTAETLAGLILKITSTAPLPLRSRAPEVPAGLEAVILRCLEKDRDARYRTVAELAVALAGFAPRRSLISIERISGVLKEAGLSASMLGVPPTSAASAPRLESRTAEAWGQTSPNRNTTNRRALLAAGVLASVGAMAAFVGYRWQAERARSAPEIEASAVLKASAAPTKDPAQPASAELPASGPRAIAVSATSPAAPPSELAPSASIAAKVSTRPLQPAKHEPALSRLPLPGASSARRAAPPSESKPSPNPAAARPSSVFDDR